MSNKFPKNIGGFSIRSRAAKYHPLGTSSTNSHSTCFLYFHGIKADIRTGKKYYSGAKKPWLKRHTDNPDFLIQSAIISAFSVAVGVPLGTMICRIIGASNGFLDLVQRSALQVDVTSETISYTVHSFTSLHPHYGRACD